MTNHKLIWGCEADIIKYRLPIGRRRSAACNPKDSPYLQQLTSSVDGHLHEMSSRAWIFAKEVVERMRLERRRRCVVRCAKKWQLEELLREEMTMWRAQLLRDVSDLKYAFTGGNDRLRRNWAVRMKGDDVRRWREKVERREGAINKWEAEINLEKRRNTNNCIFEIRRKQDRIRRENLQNWEQRLHEKWRQVWCRKVQMAEWNTS